MLMVFTLKLGPTLKQQKQKRKVPTHIISFDNENEEQETIQGTASVSAPPTCLNSPTLPSAKNTTPSVPVAQSQMESDDVIETSNKEVSEWEKW